MKKIISLALVCVMMLGMLSMVSFAAEPEAVSVNPVFGEVENWGGKTYFITWVNVGEGLNNAFYTSIKDGGAYTVKVSIADEKAKKTYVIDKYAFDNPGGEFYMDGDFCFFRFAVCEYGIPVSADATYTVRVEFIKDGAVAYAGTSETGAFDSFNDPFKADGQIVPETVPHTSTVLDGIFPEETPDTGDTPATGDATVVAVVFATVAILGMAVVVTKKVNA